MLWKIISKHQCKNWGNWLKWCKENLLKKKDKKLCVWLLLILIPEILLINWMSKMLRKRMHSSGNHNLNSIGLITLIKGPKIVILGLLMPLSGILMSIWVTDPDLWSLLLLTESMSLLLRPCIWRWDVPLLVLLEPEKLKLPRIFLRLWLKLSMCSTVLLRWTMNQWEISIKD